MMSVWTVWHSEGGLTTSKTAEPHGAQYSSYPSQPGGEQRVKGFALGSSLLTDSWKALARARVACGKKRALVDNLPQEQKRTRIPGAPVSTNIGPSNGSGSLSEFLLVQPPLMDYTK